jgi:curli biogenesis system outer membrane secretion channel CsgG
MRPVVWFLLTTLCIVVVLGCAKVQEVPQRDVHYAEIPYSGQVPSDTVKALDQQYPDGFWEDQELDVMDQVVMAVRVFPTSPNRPDFGRAVSDMIASALVNTGRVTVVEREELDALISELELSQSGLTETPMGYESGLMDTVDYIVMGSVHQVGNRQRVEARLLEVLSSRIVTSQELTVDQISVATANALVGLLLGNMPQ